MSSIVDATERWFVRRGLPHAIDGYSATEDVLTRMWPFLMFVMFVELFLTFGDRFAGWAQALVFLAGLGLLVGAFVGVNLVRRRPVHQLPDDIGWWELAVYLIVPAVLGMTIGDVDWITGVGIVVLNAVLVGVGYVITSYGVVPAIRVGFVQSAGQLRTIVHLVAKGLPMLLLITTFVFLNAEMWQVAYDFEPVFFTLTVGFMVLLAIAFLALRVPREVGELARFDSWDEVRTCVSRSDAPLPDDVDVHPASRPTAELSRVETINVGILMMIPQFVQAALIGLLTGAFYVGFGMLAVRRETVLQWTTATELDTIAAFDLAGSEVVVTWPHLAVAAFVATFSMLQFSVSSVTDATYREEFHDEVTADARDVLAVRSLLRAVDQPTDQ